MAHQQSSSEIQIQALREELDSANKKVDRYVHLVASLYEELDDLRRSICHNCKKNFVPSYAPFASSSDGSGPRPSLSHPIVSARPTQPDALSSGLPVNTAVSPNLSISTRSITVQQNQTNLAISARPHSTISILAQPSTTQDEIQPERSVSYNPEIKQSLQIDLVKTFNITTFVFCVKFSPDGKYLAVGTARSGKTIIYDVEKGFQICYLIDLYLEDQLSVWCIQFSPDNKFIATASEKIRIWDISRKGIRVAFTSQNIGIYHNALCFSPNGRFLVAGEQYCIRIWSLRDGSSKTLLDDTNGTYSIKYSPDGRHIASVNFAGFLKIWDVRTGRLLETWNGLTRDGLCVAFSPDGKGLVCGGKDGVLRYWDVGSLADMQIGRDREVGGVPGQRFQQIRKFESHKASIHSVSFSPACHWIATSQDKGVRIWDPHTAEWQCTLHGHTHINTVDFNPAGKYLASGGEDKVRLWRYRVE